MRIAIGHSPDPDDAFMVFALRRGLVETGLDLELSAEPIDRLNSQARNRAIEVTALSANAYGHLHEAYRLLPVGTSVGRDYGPVIVSNRDVGPADLEGLPVAVPGRWTTAYLVTRLALPEFRPVEVPFDEIPQAVAEEAVAAGVLIHEGQITHDDAGLVRVLDLGRWWRQETGLPLPLGVNAVLRSLPGSIQSAVAGVYRESVQYALDHRAEALDYAMTFGRGLGREDVDRFVKMYVNEDTLDLQDDVVEALEALYDAAVEVGAMASRPEIDPVTSRR